MTDRSTDHQRFPIGCKRQRHGAHVLREQLLARCRVPDRQRSWRERRCPSDGQPGVIHRDRPRRRLRVFYGDLEQFRQSIALVGPPGQVIPLTLQYHRRLAARPHLVVAGGVARQRDFLLTRCSIPNSQDAGSTRQQRAAAVEERRGLTGRFLAPDREAVAESQPPEVVPFRSAQIFLPLGGHEFLKHFLHRRHVALLPGVGDERHLSRVEEAPNGFRLPSGPYRVVVSFLRFPVGAIGVVGHEQRQNARHD